jgi:hypothetical protein
MATVRIYKVADELRRHRTIPTAFQETIEERLPIACNPLSGPLLRGGVPHTAKDSRLHYQKRKAISVYSKILKEDPDLLLPFIIAISPRRCESFDTSRVLEDHKKNRLNLNHEAESILEEIAKKTGISESLPYKKLIQELFPNQHSPPITGADGNMHWKYHAASLEAIYIIFGNHIRDAIERAPVRIRERARSETLQITECVRTNLPHQSFQDGMIWLDVGPAVEFAKILFPASRHMSIPSPGNGYEEMVDSGLDIGKLNAIVSEVFRSDLRVEDYAYYSLHGASVSAIRTVFGDRISNAIENSELRTWEKQHLLIETTDCVKMQLSRKKPHYGVVCLRIEFTIGIHIADILYKDAGIT